MAFTVTTDTGALAASSAQAICAAMQSVRDGRVYDLGVELGNETPRLAGNLVAPFSIAQFRTPIVSAMTSLCKAIVLVWK